MKQIIIAAFAALALAGCAANGKDLDLNLIPISLEPDNFCQVSKKVRWSVNDTPETIDQARKLNARWDRLCGQKPKPQGVASVFPPLG